MSNSTESNRKRRLNSIGGAVALAMLAGGLAVAAVRSEGYRATEVRLHDAGVWMTKDSVIGRLNFELKQVDTMSAPFEPGVDLQQIDSTVVVSSATQMWSHDVARNVAQGPVALPAGAVVSIGGLNGGLLDPATGNFWLTDRSAVAAIESIDGKTKGSVPLPGATELVVGVDGTAHVLAPETGEVWTFSEIFNLGAAPADIAPPVTAEAAPVSAPPETSAEPLGAVEQVESVGLGLAFEADAPLEVTAAGERFVILDIANGRLVLDDGTTIELPSEIGASARLQHPAADPEHVVVESQTSLAIVELDTGVVTVLADGGGGGAVRPVWLDGCAYGAWTGIATRQCPELPERSFESNLEPGVVVSSFRTNRGRVLLNMLNGSSWLFESDQLVFVDAEWSEALSPDAPEPDQDTTVPDEQENTCVRDEQNELPIAIDDTFTVRSGRTTVLDVLSAAGSVSGQPDGDADCDVLLVELDPNAPLPPEQGMLAIINRGRALQYTPPVTTAPGTVSFTYFATDGSGPEGRTPATVTVNVIVDGAINGPPVARPDKTSVVSGKTVVFDVLANDSDPEGDALTLQAAAAEEGALVYQPNGRVTYTAPGGIVGPRAVNYTVVDEQGATNSATLEVNVLSAEANLPPNLIGDSAEGLVGEKISVNLLTNDSDPNNDELRLSDVVAYSPADAPVPDRDRTGVVSAQFDVAGSYSYEYTVDDGKGASAKGRLRVTVRDAGLGNPPVAVRDAGTVPLSRTAFIDVLANDTDLDGDVLMVTQVKAQGAAQTNLNIEILDGRIVRVSTKGGARTGDSYTFEYTVTDGTQFATATVATRVVGSDGSQPPIALDDAAQLHLGGVGAIPVLLNDYDPDGDPIVITKVAIDPAEYEQGDPGVLFAQNGVLRYIAPPVSSERKAFTITADYEISDGRRTDGARLRISVTDPAAGNTPPTPPDLELRTFADTPAVLKLPSWGMDPDGDPVVITQILERDDLGFAEIGLDGVSFLYTPSGPRNGVPTVGAGTFTYQVVDSLGERGVGRVRLVVAPRPDNSPPVAVDDQFQVKPGKSVLIPALYNDTDADDDLLTFDDPAFEQPPLGGGEVLGVEGESLRYQAPSEPGEYSFSYYITDGQSAPVIGQVRVIVRASLENRPPIALDDPQPATVKGTVVTVDALANDRDPDGGCLTLGLTPDAERAGVTLLDGDLAADPCSAEGRRKLQVTMGDTALVFSYLVGDDAEGTAQAVVTIPAVPANRPPVVLELERSVGPEEDTVSIDVAGQFSDPDTGDEATVYTEFKATVQTPGAALESELQISGTTFVFTKNPDFAGEAVILYKVTDGEAFVDGRVTLAIEGRVNKPPIVDSDVVEVEADGAAVTFDLLDLVEDPDQPGSRDGLSVSVVGDDTEGLTSEQSGSSVSLVAAADVVKTGEEKVATVSFDAFDSEGAQADPRGTLQVRIVPTRKALPVAVADTLPAASQGKGSVTANLLANDSVPADVGPIRISYHDRQVPGGTVELVGTDSVKFTPTEGFSGETSFEYTIRDKFDDPGRESSARVTIAVKDRPAPPGQPVIGDQLSSSARVEFDSPADHGAPITSYEIEGTPTAAMTCTSSPCTVSGLTNGLEYRFRVRALNEVGASEWSEYSTPYTPDEVPGTPPAPTVDWNDQQATVTWGAIPNGGSQIVKTIIYVSPPHVPPQEVTGGQEGSSKVITGLTNGTSYTFTLKAENRKGESPIGPASATVVPVGAPTNVAAATIVKGNGFITATWPAANGNGDAVLSYVVRLYRSGSSSPEATVEVGGALRTDQIPAANGVEYFVRYTVANKYTVRYGAPIESGESNRVIPSGPPLKPASISAVEGNGTATVAIGATGDNGSAIVKYEVAVNGVWRDVGLNTNPTITGLTNGTPYTFKARAVNADGAGVESDASAAVTPFGPPATPAINVGRAGNTITWNWSTPAPNGRGPVTFNVWLDGNLILNRVPQTAYGAGFSPGEFHRVEVQACNPLVCGGVAGANKGVPKVEISWGSSAEGEPTIEPVGGTANNSALWINVVVSGFDPGAYGVQCYETAGAWNSISPNADATANVGADGRGTARPCFMGFFGRTVWVVVNGVESNHMTR